MRNSEVWGPDLEWSEIPSAGVFIVNEGNSTYNNASLSFYDIVTREVKNDIFFNTNATPLGDVATSMVIRDSLGYIVISNSGKINIININTFQYEGEITGLTSPRHMHFISASKAYVTDLYARSIAIINPLSREITGYIDVSNNSSEYNQHPTEEMVQYGRLIFTNCWNNDNKILVIDSDTDQPVDSIEVLIQPQSMVIDRFNKIWVLTDGGSRASTYGYEAPGLLRIDAKLMTVEKIWRFELGDSPGELELNGSRDTLYFINRHVYRHPVYSEQEPEVFIGSPNSGSSGRFYGLGFDPYTSDLYVSDVLDNVQRGFVYRYRLNGAAVDTFRAGIIPSSFCFK
ncbi:MAG: YncE family protein [Bacteroidales bacterium]|nr:YncE family protein [Bacteroidales bacterium]